MTGFLRRIIRRIIQPPLWWLYRWYLSGSRWYHYDQLRVRVLPSVFHPGLLFSSKILYRFAMQRSLKDKKVLELGAGAGMVALGAARAGALVTASDINPAALQSMKESADTNRLSLQILHSDLFTSIPPDSFDYIFINPPFYPRDPGSPREQAFFCGKDFEYFRNLFAQLPAFIHPGSAVYMILTDDCEIDRITFLALQEGFELKQISEHIRWGERNYIIRITKVPAGEPASR